MTSAAPRVAIDGRTLQGRPLGGIGRSLAGLLPELARHVRIDLLLDSRRPAPAIEPPGVAVHHLRAPLLRHDPVWLQTAAPRWLRGYRGLFHCPFYGLPYLQPTPMVVTIHDLTFEFAPELFSREKLFVFRRQARWAARTARRILAPSEHTRASIIDRYAKYGVTEGSVVRVRLPVDPVFGPEPGRRATVLEELRLTGPYVVALGGAPRRQLPVAVGAWTRALSGLGVEPREIPLVVVGTEAPPPGDGIVHLGALGDEQMAAVIAGARAFCFATTFEGYGMPALEAAASGVPVVCARVGSLPEVLGDAAAWCEEPEAESLGAALAQVLADDGRARSLAEAGLARAASAPTPAEAAAATARAYRAATRGCGDPENYAARGASVGS